MLKNLTTTEANKIADNLNAFIYNFGEPRIEHHTNDSGFYVYSPADSEEYVQRCYNIDYLNGWLYGCVQAANKIIRRIERAE